MQVCGFHVCLCRFQAPCVGLCRHHRYATGDIDIAPVAPLISLTAASQASSKRTTRSTGDANANAEAPWTLMSYKVDPDQAVPLGNVPLGTLAEEAATLMKGVFAAGTGSVFQASTPGGLLDNTAKPHRLTAEQESYRHGTARTAL